MKLLAAIDINAASGAVLEQAVDWANKLGGTLDLCYVDEYVYNGAIIRDPAVRQLVLDQWDRIRDEHRRRIEAMVEKLPGEVRGSFHYRSGTAWREIVSLSEGYDGLIVATHGRTGLGHLFLGSVAEKVVRGAPCPVIVLRLPPKTED